MIISETPFPVATIRITAHMDAPVDWPEFPGNMLRGAFGAALRRIACMTGMQSCAGCPLLASCPYPLLFEPPPRDLGRVGINRNQSGLPPPFALDLTQESAFPGQNLQFSMHLFTRGAIERLSFIVEAWRRVLGYGLGRHRVRGKLLSITQILPPPHGDQVLWDGDDLIPAAIQPAPLTLAGENLIIRTQTPLRLKAGGAMVTPNNATLAPHGMIATIIRGARLLAIQACTGVQKQVHDWPVHDWLQAAETICHQPHLAWQPVWRFSARQRRRMDMGGLVGEWHWQNVPLEIQAMLALGSVIHVGKQACFGLGAYAMVPAP